jgi:hypothetical protein
VDYSYTGLLCAWILSHHRFHKYIKVRCLSIFHDEEVHAIHQVGLLLCADVSIQSAAVLGELDGFGCAEVKIRVLCMQFPYEIRNLLQILKDEVGVIHFYVFGINGFKKIVSLCAVSFIPGGDMVVLKFPDELGICHGVGLMFE